MATEAEKEAAAKQREAIDVINNKPEIKEVEEKEAEVKEEVEKEEVVEAKEEEIEKVEKTEEELEEEIKNAKSDKEKEKFEKRLGKEVAKRKTLEIELAAAKAALAEKGEGEVTYTEEEVERRAEQKAEQKAAVKEFNASVARIAENCKAIDKDFSNKVTAMVEEVSGTGTFLPSLMVGILDDLPNNGGPVLMHLANNVDEYEEIYQLSPARMALKLKEISDNLVQKEKNAKKKEISKVPEPKDKLKGAGSTPEQRANEKDDMATFIKKRNKEAEEHRKNKLGLH